MTTPLESLSVVIPAFDEAARIGATLREVLAFCREHVDDFELIVVDDGSEDGTAAVVRQFDDVRLRLIVHGARAGKGRALRTGAESANKHWVLFLDADHAIPISVLARFLEPAAGAPIVVGSKRMRGAEVEYRAWRRLSGLFAQWLIRLLAVRGVQDTQCGFKLLSADVARALLSLQTIEGFGYDFELLYLARRFGLVIREVPVRCRDAGDGSVGLRSYIRTFGELLRLVRNRVRGAYPRELPRRPATPHGE